MKRFFVFGAVLAMIVLVTTLSFAQTRASTTQTVTLGVNAIYRLSVTGNPSLIITGGTAGDPALASVSEATSTYSLTINQPVGRLTVQLSAALGTGVNLTINVPSNRGNSLGTVDISDAGAHDVVAPLNTRGTTNNQPITYTLSAAADAAPFAATPYTVTWTLQE
jgi:hypothetical protein